jgi:hypothetical protein
VLLAHAGELQWGDFATWVASVGTVAAVAVALVQVYRERQSRLELEHHDREKAQEDRDERHHAHARLISAWTGPPEADPHDSGWGVPEDAAGELKQVYNYRTPLYASNTSSEPIYEVVVGLAHVQGTGPRSLEGFLAFQRDRLDQNQERLRQGGQAEPGDVYATQKPATVLSVLPPGTWRTWIRGRGWQAPMGGRLGAEVAFIDRAGVSWIRRAMGELEELPERPLAYLQSFGFYGPHDFSSPEPLSVTRPTGS